MNANGTYKNPLFGLYRDMVPAPNQNFVEQAQIPNGNYYQGGVPNLTNASNFGGRVDFNASDNDRFFFRASGTTFHEQLGDWTYESPIRSTTACTSTTRRASRGRTPATGRRYSGSTVLRHAVRDAIASSKISSAGDCTSTSRPTSVFRATWTSSAAAETTA